MTKITNIQWCHTTGNPTMGCPGCELYPTLGKIQNTIEKMVERYSDPTERITALIASECAPGPQQVKLHLPEIALRIGTAAGVADVGKFSRELVSEVSQHFRCYAAELHRRFNATGNNPGYARVFEEPRMHPGRMAKIAQMPPPTAAESEAKPWLSGMRRMIFVSDMGDALAPTIPFEFLRQEIVDVAASPTGQRQIWLWLTKQPHRMAEFSDWLIANGGTWPDNLVAMTSVTSPASQSRVGHLRRVACKYRGLSVEPLWAAVAIPFEGIDWVIVGGESGHAAKPFHVEWARAIREDAAKAGASFFLKQFGAKPFMGGAPLALADGHGGDWSEWPDNLRVREVPAQWRFDYAEVSPAVHAEEVPEEVTATKKFVIRDARKTYRRNDPLRAEAYCVWKALGGCAKPTSQPASVALAAKYGVTKSALGAIYAHFKMGHVPLAA